MSDQENKYNIEHRKKRKTTMIYEDQLSWISRNQPTDIKSEAEFICLLLSLGIQTYVKQHAEADDE